MEYSLDSLTDNPTDNQIIDLILKILDNTSGSCYVFEGYSSRIETVTVERIIRLMQYHAIAEIKGTVFGTYNYPLAITQTGTFINSRGGWLAYLAQQEKEQRQQEQRQTEAHQATLDSAKATEDSAQFASASAKAAWFLASLEPLPCF